MVRSPVKASTNGASTAARKLISFESTRFCRVASPCRTSPIHIWRAQMAFKILRKNCCGLDIHKTWIFACIGITDSNGRTEYKQARFSSFSKGLQDLADWLGKYSCSDVCMELAEKYWIPVFNILEKTCWVTLAYPSTQSRRKATKPTVKTPSGFATYTSPALSRCPTSASSAT